ncbi:MAG: hypothetical protein HYY48_08875 [Gammaproteobacteria bacterium]|nr:hypothetical protein [Gammaproteobacteria bacterium]
MNGGPASKLEWGTAIPLFAVSGVSLMLWLNPRARLPLATEDYTALILSEGLVLFFCFALTAMVIQVGRSRGGSLRRAGPAELVFAVMAATFWGGILAAFEGGVTTMTVYCGLLIAHLLWLARASLGAALTEERMLGASFLVYLACGGAAAIVRLPKLADAYPRACIDCELTFDLPTQNVLAFAVVYFGLVAVLNLCKNRLFPAPADVEAGESRQAAGAAVNSGSSRPVRDAFGGGARQPPRTEK